MSGITSVTSSEGEGSAQSSSSAALAGVPQSGAGFFLLRLTFFSLRHVVGFCVLDL